MIGYDLDKGGGPWKMFAGREPRTKSEMVFDRVLADRHHLQIGDEIEVLGKNFTIVGLSSGTTSWMTSFFFLRKEAAEDLLLAPEVTSFLFLTTTPGTEPAYILQELNKINGITALTKKEMAANDLKLFAKVFSAPLKLMVGIAFLVGGMIVGLVIYTITVERQREYGVIKAIGAPNRVLYQVVLTQAMFATTAGTILGVMLAFGFSRLIMTVKQQFLIVIDPSDVGVAFLAGLGMALIAALFPARVVADLAPAEVFRK
ncbi:ABC transporter permease [bacterium]|nr:ABC transporter permease [bacterium]